MNSDVSGEDYVEWDPPAGSAFDKVESRYRRGLTENSRNKRSQLAFVYNALLEKVRTEVSKEGVTPHEYERRLQEAGDILEDMVAALAANRTDYDPTSNQSPQFWTFPAGDPQSDRPWRSFSPLDRESLSDATARYLRRPWMQLDLIEWYLLNGFTGSNGPRSSSPSSSPTSRIAARNA